MRTLAFGAVCLGLVLWLSGYHFSQQPSSDQLYGCTVAQQAPNGECR